MCKLLDKIKELLKPLDGECEECVFYFDCFNHCKETGEELRPCPLYYPER